MRVGDKLIFDLRGKEGPEVEELKRYMYEEFECTITSRDSRFWDTWVFQPNTPKSGWGDNEVNEIGVEHLQKLIDLGVVHVRKFEEYDHHGNQVWVDSHLKGKHRDHCLCHKCEEFHPGEKSNCHIAKRLFILCVECKLVTPVYECPNFKEKIDEQKAKAY